MVYSAVPTEEDAPSKPPPKPKFHTTITYTSLSLLILLTLLTTLNLVWLTDLKSQGTISCIPFPNHTLFLPHPSFESFSEAYDDIWAQLDPPNGGFYIQEIAGTRHPFGIAMFHQLHCLTMPRRTIQEAAQALNGSAELGASGKKLDLVHNGHCIDYLRQSILCAADDTIEPPIMRKGALDMITDHDVLHRCRDRDAVWRLSEESGFIDPDVHPRPI